MINEGLRIKPIVAAAFKVATKDVVFKGYLIPQGHAVTLNYQHTMIGDAYFPNPKEFLPERFDVRYWGLNVLLLNVLLLIECSASLV